MGTRNLTVVQIDNTYKVAQYGQWDGYPAYSGVNILDFLQNYDLEKFKEKVRKCNFIDDEKYAELWSEYGVDVKQNNLISYDVAQMFYKKYETLSRDLGCKILEAIQKSNSEIFLRNSIDFANDSLFCEWAYVIDFDNNTFEIYEGFNKDPLTSDERFYDENFKTEEYHQIKLVKKYQLDNLPTEKEFLAYFEKE